MVEMNVLRFFPSSSSQRGEGLEKMMMGGGGEGMGIMGAVAPLQLNPSSAADIGGGGGGGGGGGPSQPSGRGGGKEERVPPWSQQETRDFIAIRAELERDFTVSKRNKTLWEAVAARMRERGYRRTPGQCKCKWKNLVNRYKGKETSDPEIGRQCPFFEELHAIFTERARNMQRLLIESESGTSQSKKKPKRPSGERSSDEFSEDDDDEDEDSDDERPARSKKKKFDKAAQHLPQQRVADKSKASSSIYDLLQDYFQQQQRMEVQWRETMERRAHERMIFEQEWRQTMEKLERERLMLEQAWREREEQRRIREESRAEKRDVLLTTLLNKLIQDGL